MKNFAQFLLEAPFSAPGSLPPAPGGIGGPPMGGGLGGPPMGGMPPPMPMGGGMGLGGPPMGPGMGMGGPQQQQPTGPKELKSTDVWGVLEDLLGLKDQKDNKESSINNKNMLNSPKRNHLMS